MQGQPPSPPPPPTRRVRPPSQSKSATVRALADNPTRRLTSRYDRDQRNQRFLFIGIGALVLLIVVILATGLILDNVVRNNDVVATVGSESITAGQVAAEMKADVPLMESNMRMSGVTDRTALAAQLDQAKRQLGDQELTGLITMKLQEQELARRGIVVSPADVDQKLQERIAQIASLDTLTPEPGTDVAADATDTADATETAVPSPTAAGTPTPVPTLESSAFQDAFKKQLSDLNISEARYREFIRREVLQDKLSDALGAEIPASQEQVHARHILLPTQDAANAALQRLQNGEDFAVVAADVSTDPGSKAKGGDLGWFPRGIMNAQFETAAFNLQPGQRSDVVQSPNGYHIIEVLERDPNRPVDPDTLASLKQQAYSKWLTAAQSGDDVKRSMTAGESDWLLRQIGVRP
jgi:parvulin-like peptidyl-prolyl isomerase